MSELNFIDVKTHEVSERDEENDEVPEVVDTATGEKQEENKAISARRNVEETAEGNDQDNSEKAGDGGVEDAIDKVRDGEEENQDGGENAQNSEGDEVDRIVETCELKNEPPDNSSIIYISSDSEEEREQNITNSEEILPATIQNIQSRKRKASCLNIPPNQCSKRPKLIGSSLNKDHNICSCTKTMSLLCQQMQKTADFMAQLLQGPFQNLIKPTNLSTNEQSMNTISESISNPQPNEDQDNSIPPIKTYDNAETFISDNIHFLQQPRNTGLKPILIDGQNIAMAHGQDRRFSVQGLRICIDYFYNRGHKVFAFLPAHRLKANGSDNQAGLRDLQDEGFLCVTSSWDADETRYCAYDDRILLQAAAAIGGVVVSRDQFRDLRREDPRFVELLKKALLMPTFVGDIIVFPQDPLGRNGPKLERFLKYP